VPKSRAPGPEAGTAHLGCPAQVVRHGRSQPQREGAHLEEATRAPRPRDYSWAELMRRVFEVDVLDGPQQPYSTVTLLARLRGWSTSQPRSSAMW
jgi:hypothetical protein